METPILPFVIPRDCLNGQAIGGSPLEVEAEDSDPYCPPGRVPHVCAGVAGALHGLNKMGRSPFRCCLCVQSSDSWNDGVRIAGRPEPSAKEDTSAGWARVMPGFFETIDAKMAMGHPDLLLSHKDGCCLR